MGPAHSLSGAAAWLGVGAAAAAAGHPMPWPVLVVGRADLRGSCARPGPRPQVRDDLARLRADLQGAVRASSTSSRTRVYNATREQGRPPPQRRPPHAHPHLALGGLLGAGSSAAGGLRRPLGGAGDPLHPHGARRRGPAVAGGPGLQRCAGVAARRDERVDSRRRPGQAGQRLGLALHRPGPGVPLARTADRAGRAGARHRRRAHRLRLPDPVAAYR